jgi:tRNA A37 threonylcarbamoyladenosine synthetase subunit TsaC/SUA5/YrdC
MRKILLAQTDTTVGFLSQDAKRLEEIKMRSGDKPFLKVYADLAVLRRDIRIPSLHKHRVRHSRKTTFIVKNQAFRYVSDPEHAQLIRPYGWLYSTSANESTQAYDAEFCIAAADWIIEDYRGLHELSASHIYKLGSTRLRRIR